MAKKPKSPDDVTRISLDDLPDATTTTKVVVPEPVVELVAPEQIHFKKVEVKPPVEEKIIEKIAPKPVLEKVTFERSFPHLYFYKVFSFIFIMVTFELVVHLLRYIEGVDVLDPHTFVSFFFGTYIEWNWLKVVGFLIVMYFVTPSAKIYVNSDGIYCRKVDLGDWYYSTIVTFVRWDEMAKVDYHYRFMEPYVFFKDKEGNVIGQIDFSLASPKDFFYFVERHTGRNHPFVKIKDLV